MAMAHKFYEMLPGKQKCTMVRRTSNATGSSLGPNVRDFRFVSFLIKSVAVNDTFLDIFLFVPDAQQNIKTFLKRKLKPTELKFIYLMALTELSLVHTYRHRHRSSDRYSLTLCQWLTGKMGLGPIHPKFQPEFLNSLCCCTTQISVRIKNQSVSLRVNKTLVKRPPDTIR